MNHTNDEETNISNWYLEDLLLRRYVHRYISQDMRNYVHHSLVYTGELAAGAIDKRATYTDRDGAPKLVRYNRKGEEINEIWYNPGYLQTVREGYGTGVVAYRYDTKAPGKVPFFVNAVLLYLLCEAETGFTCPVGLTQSVAFVLEKFGSEEQKQNYLTRLSSLHPDTFVQGGTFLTEIQGGSDVGATETTAHNEGDHYVLTGEKWFASNCDAEVSITLARVNSQPSTRGLGLFLLPRTLPDGTRNHVSIRRLKDKLGVRAVASGELILNGAIGYLIGEADQGFKYMAEALNVSRLGTSMAGLALAQRALREAVHYTKQRIAFGQPIIKYPMVRETLTDMVVEIEAGWALAAQMIQLFDEVHTFDRYTSEQAVMLRILLSLAKLHASELGVTATKRAMELHGGNGYIEEYVMPRLLRDAIVNPIWEGTANIQALEILKNLQKGGAEPWIKHLENTLQSIHHIETAEWCTQLQSEVNLCREMIIHVLKQTQEMQAGLAGKLARYMYDIFTALHLVEEAIYDLNSTGEKRRLRVAGHWINKVFATNSDRGILENRVVSEELFEELVLFTEIKKP